MLLARRSERMLRATILQDGQLSQWGDLASGDHDEWIHRIWYFIGQSVNWDIIFSQSLYGTLSIPCVFLNTWLGAQFIKFLLIYVSEKKKVSLADLLFRRSPKQQPGSGRGRGQQLQRVQVGGGIGYRFINSQLPDVQENPELSLKTWNAVYCALVLEEFLKELAALSLEHSVLNFDEGYVSSWPWRQQ